MERRTKYTDADFRRRPKSTHFCYQCQKDLVPGAAHRMVFVTGSLFAVHPDDVAGSAPEKDDLGWLPIGSDCARRLGLEWTRPKEQG